MNSGTNAKPNILIILNDDMGYSDIGCYGGEIETPNLDRLAANGLRYSQFYNTARCSPSRASMLTGLHPHQTGIGILTYDSGPEGYAGNLNKRCVTVAQVLRQNNYRPTERQVARRQQPDQADRYVAVAARLRRFLRHHHRRRQLLRSEYADARQRQHRARGRARPGIFLHRCDQRPGRGLYRQHTQAQSPTTPFFQYVAYTAPHWPLHAHDEDIAKYKGRFDAGWDALREARLGTAGRRRHPQAELEADRSRPDAAAVDEAEKRRASANGRCAAWRSTPRRSTAWTRASAASSTRWRETGQLDDTLVIFLVRQRRLRRGHSAKTSPSTNWSTS